MMCTLLSCIGSEKSLSIFVPTLAAIIAAKGVTHARVVSGDARMM
jgi:hypothetical protein